MDYIALRPCTFAGKRYAIGSIVPGADVADGKRQIALGTLAANPADSNITVTVKGVTLTVSEGEIQGVFDILQFESRDAVAAVQNEERENVRTIVAACDSRRAVKAAANGEKEKAGEA